MLGNCLFGQPGRVETPVARLPGNFADGVIKAVQIAGEKLARYFPPETSDKNEISNEIAYED